jgi:predicted nucleic acid-binding Zn ribbon protein
MMGRRAPRPASLAMREALQRSAPRTELASAQTAWREAVGDAIADEAEPVTEADGVLTVRCASATWAQELSLMEGEILSRLGEQLGEGSPKALKLLVG